MFSRVLTSKSVSPLAVSPLMRSLCSSSKELNFEVKPFITHKCDSPNEKVTTTLDELLGAYKQMYTVRQMEQGADKMYKSKKIQGFLHLYNGQEAIVSGIEAGLKEGDSIITAYRDHAFAYTRGVSVKSVFAELQGKVDGCSKGNGGSMHMYSKKGKFYGGNGIVGAQGPIGAGIAFTHKHQKTDNVCVTLYGDGAANQGQLFEAYNMSSLWKLPVIYVCENNNYGMGTSTKRAAANTEFYTRGDYVPGIKVDGMDYLAVKESIEYSKQFVVEKGPIILEMMTYRYVGHSMSDPGTTYRTREEVDSVRAERDPILLVKNKLLTNGYPEKDLKKVEREIRAEITKAVEEADKAEYPPLEQTYQNIFWNEEVPVRGVEFNGL